MKSILASRPTWLVVTSVAAGLPLLVVVHMVLTFYAVPSAEGGWLPTAVVLLPFVFAILLGIGVGNSWGSSAAIALALALIFGTWSYRTAPPEPARLEAVATEVGTPSGWRTISSQAGGSTWGLFGDFPRFHAMHATTDPAEEAAARYAELLEADGWERDPVARVTSPSDATIQQTWRHDRWTLSITVLPPGDEARRYDQRVPEDQTMVRIHVGY